MDQVTITAVPGIPDIRPGDDLASILATAMREAELPLCDGDIIVVAHKIVSKAEGRIVPLADVVPGERARRLAADIGKDARKTEIILRESTRVVRASKRPAQREGVLIAEHRLGLVCANAAVDESNVGQDGSVILLPKDPDHSARTLCDALEREFNVRVGVVVTDTFGRPWRLGLVNVAIGLANVPAIVNRAGESDAYGRTMSATVPAVADELAAASGLLMNKSEKKPVVVFRGIRWQPACSSARDLIRPEQEDLFR